MRIARGDRIQQQAEHDDEDQVHQDQQFTVDVHDVATGHHRDQQHDEHHRGDGREDLGQHRCDVLDHALLRLHQPCRQQHDAGRGDGRQPLGDHGVDVDVERTECSRGQAGEDSRTEAEKRCVHDPFAGEPDEVHPTRSGRPAAADVGHPHEEPQDDRRVDRDDGLGGAVVDERVDVDHDSGHDERSDHRERGSRRDAALPTEIQCHERKYEQRGIADEHPFRHDLDGDADGRGGRDDEADHDSEFVTSSAQIAGWFRGQHQLLPQPVRVLAGELTRQRIDAAHALDGDQERFVVVEATGGEVGDLPAEVVFHLVGVGGGDGLMAENVSAPSVDLALELGLRGHARPSAAGGRATVRHTWSSASATTSHCDLRSASAANPDAVIE